MRSFGMVGSRLWVVFGVAAVMTLSGCASTGDGTADEAGSAEHDHAAGDGHMHDHGAMFAEGSSALPDFQVSMKGCREGGGVSLYNSGPEISGPTPPFILADIDEDLGMPKIASYWQPVTEDRLHGIWHMSVVCESYTYNGEERGALKWGWVGMRVEPPEFDDSGIEYQFFIPDLSFQDGQIVQDLKDGLMLHASRMLDGKIDWVGPAAMHQVMDDEDHGVFQTHMDMQDHKPLTIEKIRFWLYIDMTGGFNLGHAHGEESPGHEPSWRPVALDLVNTGGGTHMVAVDGTGFLSHTRTDHHGATGGAAGNVGGVLFSGFDRTLTVGPSPDLAFNETWLH